MANYLFFEPKKHHNPNDDLRYIIPFSVIQDTEHVLKEYSQLNPSNEGLVYWAGLKNESDVVVKLVFAPQTESESARISTSHKSNFDFVKKLREYEFIQIAQVHSHPSDWVDHSFGDDELAAFKSEGLISIVVPEYCTKGMSPLKVCGIHRFSNGSFIRLSSNYIKNHFVIEKEIESHFEDFRT